jgi:hypothetical protein
MNYKREYLADQQADYRLWADFLGYNKYNRHTVMGPAAYLNSIDDTIVQIQYSRDAGCDGIATYSYAATNRDGRPNEDFYNAMVAGPFAFPAAVPDMPWKSSPTTGILFGQVSDASTPDDEIYQNWIYKATMQVGGPESRNGFTDATGTFVFMDLPPGDYTISASAAGLRRVFKNATVTAGRATKVNFQLSTTESLTIGRAAELFDGREVLLASKSVTAPTGTFEGCIYIEETDRSGGIQVRFADPEPDLQEGDLADISGTMSALNGERIIDQAQLLDKTTDAVVEPLALNLADLSRNPSPTGLLVQCAGRVTSSSTGRFALNDGTRSVEALCSGLISPIAGSLVRITGISSISADGSSRAIRIRKQADIQVSPPTTVLTSPASIGLTGFNMIGVPCAPVDPAPESVFAGVSIDGRLFGWDGSYYLRYDSLQASDFGGVHRGNGYWLFLTSPDGFSYEGISDAGAADMRISMPKRGWQLISQPFTTATSRSNVYVTDGKQTLTADEAARLRWIRSVAFSWNSQFIRFDTVSLRTGTAGTSSFTPWSGYWIRTYSDGLALIIGKE